MPSISYIVGLLSILSPIYNIHAASHAGLSVLESLPGIPHGWIQGDAVPASKRLRFRIAVKQENAYHFEQHVLDISTPNHPKYGQHMSREELKAMLRPSSDASESINGWLKTEGISYEDIEDDGDWINFYVPANEAERILNTKFYYYENTVNGARRILTLQYSVPENVRQYVQMIQPTTRFGQMRADRSTVFDVGEGMDLEAAKAYYGPPDAVLNSTFCNTTITPACLRALYNVGNFQADPNNGNKIGICGYLKEYPKYSELAIFLEMFAPNENPKINNFTYVLINGGLDNQTDTVDDDGEANLDVQYALSLAYETPSTYYSTGGLGELVPDLNEPNSTSDQNEPYLDFLHYILAQPDSALPKTLTSSYGEDEQSIPEAYTNITCSLFAQLGARGVSVFISSGDTGVGSGCQTNDGKNTTRFLPQFPATCPFVTSVGGTFHVKPEEAIFFSSGGFSDRFPRPAYQDAAVSKYLSILGSQWEGLYNPAGRGFPDVAAQSVNFTVVGQGRVQLAGGTSAASPTFAGIVALLNSARLSAGKPSLGFLNPWIYQIGHWGLNDITTGGSIGCTGEDIDTGLPAPFVPFASWNATPGWDPVTGYGTPDFEKLLGLSLMLSPDYKWESR